MGKGDGLGRQTERLGGLPGRGNNVATRRVRESLSWEIEVVVEGGRRVGLTSRKSKGERQGVVVNVGEKN